MILSDVSIKRPVFATMLNLVLVVFGLFALPRLAIDQYPDVDFPVVSATVVYPGADPETIEQRVLDPLEKAVNGISGLDTLQSTAYPNIAQLVLKFKLDKKGDLAAQEVRDKIFAVLSQLPDEAETPIIQKFDVGGAPILNISVSSETMNYGELSRYAADTIQPALERVNGVARIDTAGIREREIHILVDREKLSSMGLTPQDLMTAVQTQSVDIPSGKLKTSENTWSIRVKGKARDAAEIANLPVQLNGRSLRVGDLATVQDTIAEEETAAYIGKTPTILLSASKQSGGNTTQIADDLRKNIDKLKQQLPPSVKIDIVSDNSTYIKGSIDAVKLDLVLGALLATLIVFVFLRDFWITLISAVALPTSVIATFAFIQSMGFTLNMMTTLGLSLAIGILIDDAIIVIENIHRHLAMGKNGPQAAKDATSEIGLAVFATTLTICAVFVPVAFMEGIIGRFFYQFGLTVAFAVLVSLFCAFTIAPMLSARLLKPGDHKPHNPKALRAWYAVENSLTWLDNTYRSILQTCMNHRALTLLGGFGVFIFGIVLLVMFVPVSFFPKEDKSQFNINLTLPEGASLDATRKVAFDIVDRVQTYPGVNMVIAALAATGDKKPNKAKFDVLLIPKGDRSFSQAQLIQRIRDDLGPTYNANGTEFTVTEAGGGGGGRTEPIQMVFRSDNWEQLVTFTDQVKEHIKTNIPGAVDTNSTKPKVAQEFRVVIDQGRAADLQVSAAQIGGVLRALYEGDKVGEIESNGKTVDVRLRISDQDRISAADLGGISLMNRKGQLVTLGSIAQIQAASAPSAIERFNSQRQITVFSGFTGKDLRGAIGNIQAFAAQNMPAEVSVSLAGEAEVMADAITNMLRALAIAILLVFMILCAQYESYLAPLVIMASLPLSLTGAFGSLLITGQVMSVYTMIGIILLMGLVTKNGILLIDFTMQRMRDGLSVNAALLEAGPIRLRPILMTTFAAGGGMLPIAFGHGEGGEARSPMGVAVIGGLLLSTVLTLVVVPCAFSLVEEMKERWVHRRERKNAKGGGSFAPIRWVKNTANKTPPPEV
ncbi:MAG TPA: efflux RND transporter permease subunit [Oligoflexus sp.]|uniref:efflux RND transporter permease subunit n=1 Tax=Oligoflexus sp. TaxID=1971216 RepID=UPI002D7196A9|nr:efflux RND transporter permease subunit [Oligoflexus sp.]HYX34904.1 efflux RND transporter permease subunit [Oligoflexus sp.]